jgi:hypothetical protein
MVIPNTDDRAGRTEFLVAEMVLLESPFFGKHLHVIRIAIDIVSQPNPKLGLKRGDRRPERLGEELAVAGSKGDALERLFSQKRREVDQKYRRQRQVVSIEKKSGIHAGANKTLGCFANQPELFLKNQKHRFQDPITALVEAFIASS